MKKENDTETILFKYFWINNLFYYIPFFLFTFALFQDDIIGRFIFKLIAIDYNNFKEYFQDLILLTTFFQTFMIVIIFIIPGGLYSLININLRNIIHKEVSFKDRILLSLNDFFDWLFYFPCIMIFKNPYTHKINIGISLGCGFFLIFWIINLIENLFVKQKRWYFTNIKLQFILNKIKKNNIGNI